MGDDRPLPVLQDLQQKLRAEELAQSAANAAAGQQTLPSGAASLPRAEERAQSAAPSAAGQHTLPSSAAAFPRVEERAQSAIPSAAGQQTMPSGAAAVPRAEERAQSAAPSAAGQQTLPCGAAAFPRAEERAQTAAPYAAGQQTLPSGAAALPRTEEHGASNQQQTPPRMHQGTVAEQHVAMSVDTPPSSRPVEAWLSTQAGWNVAGEPLLSSAISCPWAGSEVCRADWMAESSSCSHQASAEEADMAPLAGLPAQPAAAAGRSCSQVTPGVVAQGTTY